MEAGADVFRLNFSHSDHAWHAQVLRTIRQAEIRRGTSVAVIQDLCGPKMRLSHVAQQGTDLNEGELVRITTQGRWEQDPSRQFDLATTYEHLLDDVRPGDRLLIDDGRVELTVEECDRSIASARVVRGGPVSVGKGLNLPGVRLSTPSLTEKDWADLAWGIAHEVDYVALSFVRHPDDVAAVQERLAAARCPTQVIAKIERPEALEHVDAIIDLADGLMVARGDLGLETDLARVPLLQKQLIERCRAACKPVITATQMLDSMMHASTPTRAEVSDVANAVYDGSDAIMLSGETAAGRFPIEAVRVLDRVARMAETDAAHRLPHQAIGAQADRQSAIVGGAVSAANCLGARRIIALTRSGRTARMLAENRLPIPVTAITNCAGVSRQLALSYGVESICLPQVVIVPQLLHAIECLTRQHDWAEQGERLIVISSLDGCYGQTDTLHVYEV